MRDSSSSGQAVEGRNANEYRSTEKCLALLKAREGKAQIYVWISVDNDRETRSALLNGIH
jgi:hypothetical protein